MRVLHAGPLTLEPQLEVHAKEMFDVLSDPAIYRYEMSPPASLGWLKNRFARLESRASADGSEHWLNWVIRLHDDKLIGYVQASAGRDGNAYVAYVLSSSYWGMGHASAAVQCMISELADAYHVQVLWAILKQQNRRSHRLLERLGFSLAGKECYQSHEVDADEHLMRREATVRGFHADDSPDPLIH